MVSKGDTERQAILRDGMIKKGTETKRNRYVSKILHALKPRMRDVIGREFVTTP